jgi:uncharacterized membrane protein
MCPTVSLLTPSNSETASKPILGALPGGASSAAFWINEKGWITGNSENGETDPLIPGLPEVRAVLWKHGKIQDLGTLGGSSSFSQAVNNRGQVTGLALNRIPDPFSLLLTVPILPPVPDLPVECNRDTRLPLG